MVELEQIGQRAKEAEGSMRALQAEKKNQVLAALADKLIESSAAILAENEKDIKKGKENKMPEGLVDRLTLTKERIADMAQGLQEIVMLNDPIGSMVSVNQRPNGLKIGKQIVPLGVVGIIYEARPNVTVDAFGLCFKTGNVSVLRGGSDAAHSNAVIVKIIRSVLKDQEVTEDAIQLLEDADHEVMGKFMKMNSYIDVLIPRGGAGLIRSVVENATIPVIKTGTGNCHIYVDESADLEMAVNIVENAKTQRIGVCNACESLVVHEKVVDEFMPMLKTRLDHNHVEIRGDESVSNAVAGIVPATKEDWGTEYLDYILSAKTVSNLDEAIAHINRYNTGHSEAIITKDYESAMRFLNEIDAAAVYVNASTRFTDGHEFGFGAEIGISTQKLHARGPMGLDALTTTKYVIFGSGQVRK